MNAQDFNKRFLPGLLIVFIALFTGATALTGCGSQASFGDPIVDGEPTPIPTAVVPIKPVFTVQRGDIVYAREFYGRIAPSISQPLLFRQDGRVLDVYVARGADVQAGDVLAVLDTSVLEEQLAQAQTDLEIARSLLQSVTDQVRYNQQRAQLHLDLAQLRLDYARAQAADPPAADDAFTIREREIERDLAQIALDEAQTVIDPELRVAVTRAEKRVADIEAQIAAAQLVAPMSGSIQSLRISVGTPITAFEPIGTVADLGTLEVQDALRSDEMSELSEGMAATIQAQNRPGDVFAGTISALPAPFGSGDDDLTRVRFNDPAAAASFEVGDRVSILVTIAERSDVLWLPQAALREFNGRVFVVVEHDGIQQRVDVELGLAGDGLVEIVSGVDENQTVIGP